MKFEMPKGPMLGKGKMMEEESDDSADGAASDILEAIADKDAAALNLALKRHYEMCAGEGEDDSDDEE